MILENCSVTLKLWCSRAHNNGKGSASEVCHWLCLLSEIAHHSGRMMSQTCGTRDIYSHLSVSRWPGGSFSSMKSLGWSPHVAFALYCIRELFQI